jgi:hypothetical protein
LNKQYFNIRNSEIVKDSLLNNIQLRDGEENREMLPNDETQSTL